MVNKYNTLSVLLLSVLLASILVACSSKRFVNKALKYDEAGMYQEAAALYLRSLASNQSNMDARMGLMRTGSLVLAEKLNTFINFHKNRQHKEAVYAFQDAEKYYNQVAAVGVKLNFPEQNKIYYAESKEEHLSHLYREGMKALSVEAFGTAEPMFREILALEPTYKDTREHWITARYEPQYRNGISFFENQLYRKAYYAFDKIISETGSYKESFGYKDQSLKAATLTIAVLPFYVQDYNFSVTANELRAKTINEIHQLKTPFYKLINDPVIGGIRQLERLQEPQTALRLIQEAGPGISAQSVLFAKVIRYSEHTSPLTKTEKPAYLKKTVEITQENGLKETKTEYIKTTYTEYTRQSKASITVEFSLIHLKTGEILVTDVFTFDDGDQIDYAEFKGEHKDLVPGEWKKKEEDEKNDKVFDTATQISELQQKLKARKEFREGPALTAQLIQNAARRISFKIEQYNPEK